MSFTICRRCHFDIKTDSFYLRLMGIIIVLKQTADKRRGVPLATMIVDVDSKGGGGRGYMFDARGGHSFETEGLCFRMFF